MMVITGDFYGIIYVYIYNIHLGKFHHDLTVLPNPGTMVYFMENSTYKRMMKRGTPMT